MILLVFVFTQSDTVLLNEFAPPVAESDPSECQADTRQSVVEQNYLGSVPAVREGGLPPPVLAVVNDPKVDGAGGKPTAVQDQGIKTCSCECLSTCVKNKNCEHFAQSKGSEVFVLDKGDKHSCSSGSDEEGMKVKKFDRCGVSQ